MLPNLRKDRNGQKGNCHVALGESHINLEPHFAKVKIVLMPRVTAGLQDVY